MSILLIAKVRISKKTLKIQVLCSYFQSFSTHCLILFSVTIAKYPRLVNDKKMRLTKIIFLEDKHSSALHPHKSRAFLPHHSVAESITL